jgi:hypothetical protein
MKRILLAVCGVATAVTLASAQTPPSSTDPANPQTPQTQAPQTMDPGRDMQKSDKNITLTGCVRSGDAAGQYVLAKPADASSAGSAASSETSGTGAVGTSGRAAWALGDKFRLSGKTTDVGQHLNHKVEISGELNKDASSSSYGTAGSAGSAGAAGGAAASASLPEIKVKSVRMISESCS